MYRYTCLIWMLLLVTSCTCNKNKTSQREREKIEKEKKIFKEWDLKKAPLLTELANLYNSFKDNDPNDTFEKNYLNKRTKEELDYQAKNAYAFVPPDQICEDSLISIDDYLRIEDNFIIRGFAMHRLLGPILSNAKREKWKLEILLEKTGLDEKEIKKYEQGIAFYEKMIEFLELQIKTHHEAIEASAGAKVTIRASSFNVQSQEVEIRS